MRNFGKKSAKSTKPLWKILKSSSSFDCIALFYSVSLKKCSVEKSSLFARRRCLLPTRRTSKPRVGAFGKRKTPPKVAKAAKPRKNNCGASRKNKRKKRRNSARNSLKPSRKKSEKCCAGNRTPNASFRKHSEANNVVSNDFGGSKIKGNPPGAFGNGRTPPMVSFCQSDFARRPPGIRKDRLGFLFGFPTFSASEHFPKTRLQTADALPLRTEGV